MSSMNRYDIWHNAAHPCCRSPLGAVFQGTAVRLALYADAARQVQLLLYDEQGVLLGEYDMERQGPRWVFVLPPLSRCAVYGYCFCLQLEGEQLWYGAACSRSHSCSYGELLEHPPHTLFSLCVYAADFATPPWMKAAVMYQIFPDRFAKGDERSFANGVAQHRARGRQVRVHERWDEPVEYLPAAGEQYYQPIDYYGGSLSAICRRLPYLKELGVDVIYLNPVFEAASNHRYNTADYRCIDPVLGSNDDLRRLCEQADELGMHVLLDGVFSHTGSDSRYFDNSDYEDAASMPGAANSKDSAYGSWYEFFSWPHSYRCWWGFDSLPEVDEHDASWQRFIITDEDSVIKYWLRQGVNGYRLDVADELPDDVLTLMRQHLRSCKSDAVLLGEVWEDALSKISYGVRRRYALGSALDSVMNYPWRGTLLDFFLGRCNAFELADFLLYQQLNYPPPMYECLMNLLSSHDVERVRSVLARGDYAAGMSRAEQAAWQPTAEQERSAQKLHEMLALLQFSLPGMPAVYYGDELGMHGLLDPFNRAPLQQGDYSSEQLYRQLGKLRHSIDELRSGGCSVWAVADDVLCVLRIGAKKSTLSVINRGEARREVVDIWQNAAGADQKQQEQLRRSNYSRVCRLLEVGQQQAFEVNQGLIELELGALSAAMWRLE